MLPLCRNAYLRRREALYPQSDLFGQIGLMLKRLGFLLDLLTTGVDYSNGVVISALFSLFLGGAIIIIQGINHSHPPNITPKKSAAAPKSAAALRQKFIDRRRRSMISQNPLPPRPHRSPPLPTASSPPAPNLPPKTLPPCSRPSATPISSPPPSVLLPKTLPLLRSLASSSVRAAQTS
jgi:hypothetical protein